jgi:hypothetical protein
MRILFVSKEGGNAITAWQRHNGSRFQSGTRFCDVKNIWKNIHKSLKNKDKFIWAFKNSYLN